MTTTADEIQKLREERGISVFEAKKIIAARQLHQRINDAGTMDDLKSILRDIVDVILPQRRLRI